MSKLIIFSAPSGSGKSTIINYLLTQPQLKLAFSISATSRAPRGTEQDGVEYFFLTPEEFRRRIEAGEFLEYEEVYKDRFYGTLKSQVEKQLREGENVIFDVDVVGGCNIKQFYGDRALSVFIQPPSIEELRKRLEGRGTDALRLHPAAFDRRAAQASGRQRDGRARCHREPPGQGCLRADLRPEVRPRDCQRRPGDGQGRGSEGDYGVLERRMNRP